MRIHHLNCVSACPLGGLLMDGRTVADIRGRLVSHCLLAESNVGLVLVDTGYGLRDVHNPESRLSRFFLFLNSPAFREEMTAARQIERLGFKRSDVRHIVLTHLDFDHAGGLDDFPEATVHMLKAECDAALAQRTMLDRMRYRPAQWSTRDRWRTYDADGAAEWFGFTAVRELDGVPPEIVMVPLVGHTFGHAGIAVQSGERWKLLAGDAYFYHAEMAPRPRCTPGLRFYQTMMEKDRRARLANQKRLRALKRDHGDAIEIVCAHDRLEFERMAGRPFDVPLASPSMSRETDGHFGEPARSV